MRLRLPLPASLLAVFASGLLAQVVPIGSIGAIRQSTNQFGVHFAASGLQTCTTGGFGGTSLGLMWDPDHPDAWYVAGTNFIGRATLGGAGTPPPTVAYSTLSTAAGNFVPAGLDPQRRLIVIDAIADQIRRFDPVTNTLSNVTSGVQPWATLLADAVVHPQTGDIYATSGSSTIFRVLAGATTATIFLTIPSMSIQDIALDPFTCSLYVAGSGTAAVGGRLLRQPLSGPAVDLIPAGTFPNSIVSVAVDENGDVVFAENLTGAIRRTPYAGGVSIQIAAATGFGSSSVRNLSVAGIGRNGGPTRLHSLVSTAPGAVSVRVQNFSPGNQWAALISLDPQVPTGSGPLFGVALDAFPQIFSPVFTGVTTPCGGGRFDIPAGVPAGIHVDSVALDFIPATALLGFSSAITFTTL